MGHRALTRQKRKCRLARQMSMTMLTMQVRAMASCTGRSMARKGKATMAPPMPLTPETKPPAIQARNTQISVIPGIRPSCGHGPPHQCMKNRKYLPSRSASVRRRRDDSHGETIPHAAIAVPPGVSRTAFPVHPQKDGLYRRSLRRMRLPAPQGAVRAVRQPSAPHGIAPRSPGRATVRADTMRHGSPRNGASCLRAPSGPRPLPCRPARMRNRSPRSPCLGRSRPFGNRKKEKRHKKREPVQNGQAPAYSP